MKTLHHVSLIKGNWKKTKQNKKPAHTQNLNHGTDLAIDDDLFLCLVWDMFMHKFKVKCPLIE